MPTLHPVEPGRWDLVNVQLDSGDYLYAGKKRAVFSLQEARRVSCYRNQLRAWLAQKNHSKVDEDKPTGKPARRARGST